MSDFTQSAFEGSLLLVIVYNENIKTGLSEDELKAILASDLSESEIEYFFDNFEIIDTYDFYEDIGDIEELADSGYLGNVLVFV